MSSSPPKRHTRRDVSCEACAADLGTMRPAAGGGVYLDLTIAAIAWRRNPDAPGRFTIVCRCGHERVWEGEAVTGRRRIAA